MINFYYRKRITIKKCAVLVNIFHSLKFSVSIEAITIIMIINTPVSIRYNTSDLLKKNWVMKIFAMNSKLYNSYYEVYSLSM